MTTDYENEIANHVVEKFMHVTKDGQRIQLSKLDDGHLQNILNLLRRKAKEGIKVRYGGGTTPDDMWYDEDILTGEQALKKLNYYEYLAEQERRKSSDRPLSDDEFNGWNDDPGLY